MEERRSKYSQNTPEREQVYEETFSPDINTYKIIIIKAMFMGTQINKATSGIE